MEVWKSISGFEGLYEVSNFGNVKSCDRYVMNNGGKQHRSERLLKPHSAPTGHCSVVLCKEGKTCPCLVHRLVAQEFIPNPENKPVVDHIDTNPLNNHVDNLCWVTTQENCMNELTRKHQSDCKKGHPYWGRPLTKEERRKIALANTGRKASVEQRKRLSEAHKGQIITEECRIKISNALKGHPTSEETRRKISQAHKLRYQKIREGLL